MKLVIVLALGLPVALATRAHAQELEPWNEYGAQIAPAETDTLPAAILTEGTALRPAWHSFITNVPGDWVRSGQGAFRMESVPAIAGTAVATGLLYIVDHQTSRAAHGFYERSHAVQTASNFMVRVGDGRSTLGVAAAFVLYGFVGDDDRALRTGSQTIEAMFSSGIVVQILKRVAGRESPQVASMGRGAWRPFPSWKSYNSHQSRYYAFPSGHVTTTMATVTVIAENYPEIGWIRPVGYTIVGLVGTSLVNVGWHWYSDFPLAVLLGYAFGSIAAHRDEAGSGLGNFAGTPGLKILPTFTAEGPGVTLALCF